MIGSLIGREILTAVRALGKDGMFILLAEQNAKPTLNCSDFVYVLETGKPALSGPARQLAQDP